MLNEKCTHIIEKHNGPRPRPKKNHVSILEFKSPHLTKGYSYSLIVSQPDLWMTG